jgi:glycosyltransferase involved in cell wall biosynthesis
MKVFMFSSVHPWNDSRIYFKQAKSLAKHGYKVQLVAIESEGINTIEENSNLKIQLLPRSKRRIHRPLRWMKLFILAFKSKADIYHFHDPELLPVGFLLKVILNKKVVYDIHEDFPASIITKSWIPLKIRNPLSKLLNRIELYLSNFMNALVFAEAYYKERFSEINRPLKLDVLNYPLKTLSDRNILIRRSNNISLVYAGAISRERGILEMTEAFCILKKDNPNISFNIIGEISEDLIKEIDEIFCKFNLTRDGFYLRGRISLDKVYEYYSQSQIGLCILHPVPNYTRSLATKLFEYMSTGLAIVASNFDDWRMLIEDANCGLVVDPYDVREVVAKIQFLIDNPSLIELYGKNGRSEYERKYNWDEEEAKLINLYQRLLV